MIHLFLCTFLFLLPLWGAQQSVPSALIINDRNVVPKKLDISNMLFIAEVLTSAKPALNLDCEVRVREIKQEKKFSTGPKIVEMLEIKFRSGLVGEGERKFYFPVGSSTVKVLNKNSSFAGLVEEFELQADDLLNSRFIFQHDGMGRLIWMTYETDLHSLPCRLK